MNTSFTDFFDTDSNLPYDSSDELSVISYLKKCAWAYYTEGEKPLIDDQEYDQLYELAKSSWPNNSFFSDENVGINPSGKNKIEHEFVLGSLTKYKNENILDWLNQYDESDQIIVLPKFDGLSVYAEYNNGKLIKASTRGNGIVGIDITEKVKIIRPEINCLEKVKLRGEILLQGDSYKDLGFANRRNGASGLIGLKNIDKEKLKYLIIVFYELIEPELDIYDGWINKILDSELKVNIVKNWKKVSFDEIFKEFKKECSDIDLDGLVLIHAQNYKRENAYHPSNKVCWKPVTETAIAEIGKIEWTTTRTGRVVPVAIFKEPVQLDGTQVSRATCYNARTVLNMGLKIGTKVEICKSNYIIPKILKLIGPVFQNGTL